MKTVDSGPDEQRLREALRALARVEAAQAAPSHVEDAVMREWQSVRGRQASWGRLTASRTFTLAVAASLVLGLLTGGWWIRGGVEPRPDGSEPLGIADTSAWHSYDMLAWLDPDPQSLQIVRLRVASETLRTQGYAVSDPDGDGTVEIEMVLGSDGMARSVLVTSAWTPMN